VSHAFLDQLTKANRPDQFGLLERSTDLLTASPTVTHLLVRGSLASGTADRLSDVDFVVGVDDRLFPEFISVLDALISVDLGAILPGWRDTIVSNMGGLGFVYLIGWAGELQQVDLYVVPASRVRWVHKHTVAHPIYVCDTEAAYDPDPRVAPFIAHTLSKPRSCAELLIETLVVGYLMRKRITRGQDFIAYSEAYVFNTAAKDLIKAALAPTSHYYGWYQLREEIGSTPIGKECLRDLGALISAPPIPIAKTLADRLDLVVAIAERAAPEAVDSLRTALDAYRYYLELT
jgi:predicted nucleotidyltransferase